MHTTTLPKQADSQATQEFYWCLNSLISYVFELLDTGYPHNPLITSKDSEELDCASYVLDNIWDNPNIIKHFVQDNPCKLSPYYLNIIGLWRFALRDIFICLKKSGNTIIACNTERLFEVSSLMHPIAQLVGPMPSLATFVVLPYQDRLVCDGRIKRIGKATSKRFPYSVDHYLHLAAEQALITTPNELIRYRQTLKPNHDVTAAFELELINNALCSAEQRAYIN